MSAKPQLRRRPKPIGRAAHVEQVKSVTDPLGQLLRELSDTAEDAGVRAWASNLLAEEDAGPEEKVKARPKRT